MHNIKGLALLILLKISTLNRSEIKNLRRCKELKFIDECRTGYVPANDKIIMLQYPAQER